MCARCVLRDEGWHVRLAWDGSHGNTQGLHGSVCLAAVYQNRGHLHLLPQVVMGVVPGCDAISGSAVMCCACVRFVGLVCGAGHVQSMP